jgi:hypothetical protein
MNTSTRLVMTGLLCVTSLTAYAEQDMLISRSAGKLVEDNSIELMAEVKNQELVVIQVADRDQTRGTTSTRSSDGETTISNRNDQDFSIYDANAFLLSDLDGDGYHHALNVFFDIDVSYDSATVYTKLYLSRDGGPWSQYQTTDLFNIVGDSYGDAYEVTTELLEGYPPGYYDILIEVFSLNHAGMVTSQVLDHHYLGKDIMLEDLSRDEGYFYEEEYYSYGAGSFSLIWLLLIFQVVTAARSAITLTPEI